MTASRTIHVSAGCSRIEIPLDKLRLTLPFPEQLPKMDWNPLTVPVVLGSHERHSCSKDHAL